VETGLASAVRRLLTGIVASRPLERLTAGFPQQGIPWDYVGMVEPGTARIRLKSTSQLVKMHPADLADILEDLGAVERREIVTALDPETAAQALSEADPSVQASVVEEIRPDQAADLLEEMAPDEAADILGDLSEERSQAVLAAMESEEAQEIRDLLRFPEDSAGGLMTSEFFLARATGPSARRWPRSRRSTRTSSARWTRSRSCRGRTCSSVSSRWCGSCARAGGAPVREFMRREARAVETGDSFREVVERFEKYHLRALAVVDEAGRLAG